MRESTDCRAIQLGLVTTTGRSVRASGMVVTVSAIAVAALAALVAAFVSARRSFRLVKAIK